MKRFFKGPKFKVLLCVIVLLAGFMAYAGATGQLTTLPGRAATAVLSPFQRAGSAISNGVGGLWSRFARFEEVQRENEQLRARVAELENELVELDQYRSENQQYREFYDLQQQNPGWTGVPAFVVGRDALSQFYAFTIGQGSLAGIAEGDAVVSSTGGLVGTVVEVGANWARVKTILDPGVQAAVMVSSTRDSGLAGGNAAYAEDGHIVMTQLARDSAAEIGGKVVTTGLGGAFPENLLVGTIEEIHTASTGTSLYALLRPTEDLATIQSVMVLTGYNGEA